jgi:hypothetical protein
MKPSAWGLAATAVAAGLFLAVHAGTSKTKLRRLGATGGAVAAIARVALVARRRESGFFEVAFSPETAPPRFLFERRRAARSKANAPLQVRVNGQPYRATLVNVSATGALLRLQPPANGELRAKIGQPVCIGDVAAGTVARVGMYGLYMDFAVQLDASHALHREAALTSAELSRRGPRPGRAVDPLL